MASPDPAVLGEFLVRLGGTMTKGGESVDKVQVRLSRIANAYGIKEAEIVVLPTALYVETGSGASSRMHMGSLQNARAPRLDQLAALYDLVHEAEQAAVEPGEGLSRLQQILDQPPLYGRLVRILGYGLLSIGFSLLLQPSPLGIVAALVLGCLVGLLTTLHLATLRPVLPVLAAFAVALVVFGLADTFDGENPVRLLIPPLVTFLPGAVLTTGTAELAAGQVISGSSRLVQGVVELALLAFGIVAAGVLVGTPPTDLIDQPFYRLGAWAPWVGLVVVTIGDHYHHCAPRRTMPFILAVLVVAYSGQALGAAVFSAELSGFFGAVAMTPLALWFSDLPIGPPQMVTFLPGFWLLVPGAAGLIGVTEIVGTNSPLGPQDLGAALVTVMSIALGVLIGSAAYYSTRASVRTVTELPGQLTRWRRTR